MRKTAAPLLPLALLLLCVSARAQGPTYTPAPGSAERRAVADALRAPVERELRQKVVFKIDALKLKDGWAFLRGVRVIVAGLDQDYTGKPFEPMPQLLAVAEYITKTHAICVRCGQPANYSQRIVEVEGQVVVGAADTYEARCRRCFVPHADAPTRYIAEA